MKTGWIVGIVTAYIIMAIIGVICDQIWFHGETWDTINTLMSPNWSSSGSLFQLIIHGLTTIGSWLQALLTVIFLKFDFWSGPYIFFWYIFCIPLGVAVIASIVIGVIHR